MIIFISTIVSDLIDSEVSVYISKMLEHAYIADNSSAIKKKAYLEFQKLVAKGGKSITSNANIKKRIDTKQEEYIFKYGKYELIDPLYAGNIKEAIDKNLLFRINNELKDFTKENLLETTVKIEQINSVNITDPTFIKLTFGDNRDDIQEFMVGIKCLSFYINQTRALYEKIVSEIKQYHKMSSIMKYIYLKTLKLKRFIFSSTKFRKNILNSYYKYINSDFFTPKEYSIMRKLVFEKKNSAIVFSINDISEINILDQRYTTFVNTLFEYYGFDYLLIDDPGSKRVFLWSLKKDKTMYHVITYDMLYSSILRKTNLDIEKVRKSTEMLFHLKRPNSFLIKDVGFKFKK